MQTNQKLNFFNLISLFMLIIMLASCAGTTKPIELSIHSTNNANENSPLSVDFVAVYDQEILDSVSSISASQWFQIKNQLKKDHPNGFQVTSWEVVPGSDLPMQMLDYKRKILTTFVFVNYFSESEHRVRLMPKEKVVINLLDNKFTISNGENATDVKSDTGIFQPEKEQPKDNNFRRNVILKSAVLPGWGQYDNNRKLPASIYAVAFCGSLGWYIYNIVDYNSNVDECNDLIDKYSKSTGDAKIKYYKEANDKIDAVNDIETMQYISLCVLGGVYVVNLLDAAFLTPENNQEKKVTLAPKIDFNPDNPKLGVCMKWNF